MKNTKLLIAAILTALTLSIVSCNNKEPKDTSENPTESQQSITEETSDDIKEDTTTKDDSSQENNSTTQSENKSSEEKPKASSNNQTNTNNNQPKESNKNTSTEKPKTPKPATQAPVAPPKTENAEPQVYTNNNFGFSLTFPASWKDKYTVKEADNGIYVFMKLQNSQSTSEGFLFAILKKGPNLDESMFDTITKEKRYFDAKGITYVIGGSTDFPIDTEGPNFQSYLKMSRERASVVKTLKAI
ncbi:hypothetical protein [Clostridium intestinale]|uniref:Lipoprotein n=1 Tax=Clostridium intestinale URNW TaxID=1294142 RepID=U2NIK5_9CLOT|nr:hypothetical protein [Clostridium intestinale]ERK28973.1 hypothetical protein CINTURNW_3787 [Clostridium intestinale URNW]